MKQKKCLSFLIIIILQQSLISQEIDFSNLAKVSTFINPTNAGNFSQGFRLSSNYKIKKSTGLNNFRTIYLSADGKIFKNRLPENNSLGIGVLLFSDKNNEGLINRNYISLSSSYHLVLDRYNYHKLGIGFAATLAEIRLNPKRLIFENPAEIIYNYGFVNITDQSALLSVNPIHYVDYSLGVQYIFINPEKKIEQLSAGIGIHHINSPQYESTEISFKIYPKFSYHIEGIFGTFEGDAINFQLLYNLQKLMSPLFFINSMYNKKINNLNHDYTLSIGGGFKNDYFKNNFVTTALGIIVNKIEINLSYDFNITSKQTISTNRASELGITYLFK